MTKPAPAKPAASKSQPAARKGPALVASAENSINQIGIVTLMSLIMVGALAAFVYGNERSDIMLAVSHESRGVTSLKAMDTPNIGSDALINWSKLAVSEIFTYNFNDISPRLIAAQRYFTKAGWKSFLTALGEQKVLDQVETQRQFLTTIPGSNAVISSEGEEKGTYYWTVQMNTVTSVYTGNTSTKYTDLNIMIARVPTRSSDAGYPFGIAQIRQ